MMVVSTCHVGHVKLTREEWACVRNRGGQAGRGSGHLVVADKSALVVNDARSQATHARNLFILDNNSADVDRDGRK